MYWGGGGVSGGDGRVGYGVMDSMRVWDITALMMDRGVWLWLG